MVNAVNFFSLGSFKRFLQKLQRLRHELVWVTLGQFVAFVGGFTLIKILTRAMGPELYGQLALGLTVAGVVNLFVYGPVAQWVLRFYSVYRERQEVPRYLHFVRKVVFQGGLIVALVATLITVVGASRMGKEWVLLVIAAVLYGIASGISGVIAALFSALRRRAIVAIHQGVEPWVRSVISLLMLLLFGNSGYMALIGFSIGALIIAISQVAIARRDDAVSPARRAHHAKHEADALMVRGFRQFIWPFMLFAVFGSVTQYADRWVLQGLYGASDVGIYAVMYQIANAPMLLLFGMISQFAMPIIFEHAGAMTSEYQDRRSRRALHQTVFLSGIAIAVPMVVAYLYGEQLIRLIAAPQFAEHHAVLWVLVLGLGIFNLAQLLVTRGFSLRRTSIYVWPKALHAVSLAILLGLLGSVRSVGVAMAVLVASTVYLAAVVYANRSLRV